MLDCFERSTTKTKRLLIPMDINLEKPVTKHTLLSWLPQARHWLFAFQIVLLFAGWRVALWLAAYMGKHRLNLGKDPAYTWISDNPWVPGHLPEGLSFFTRWDSGWYLSILEHGYVHDIGAAYSNLVFFPLYPLLAKSVSLLSGLDPLRALLLVANVALFAALPLLYKLARKDLNTAGSWRALLLFLLFPTAVFLGSAYTEGLFLLLSVGAFLLARNNKWWWAGLLGALAAATRPSGLFLAVALAIEYFEQRKWRPAATQWNVFAVFLPLLGLIGYMSYLWAKFGNPFLFLSGQDSWGRSTVFSLPAFLKTTGSYAHDLFLYHGPNLAYALGNNTDFLFFSFGIIAGLLVLIRLRISYGIYILLSILIPALTDSFHSIPRFCAVLFPIAFLIGRAGGKHPGLFNGLLAISAVLFTLFSMMFSNLWWVA